MGGRGVLIISVVDSGRVAPLSWSKQLIAFASDILEWLRSWPSAVWSTICGSAITLTGVMFSDWRNTRRLQLQHQFAANESELARRLATRKEVYLSAAGALARAQEYLMSLATVDIAPGSAPVIEFAEFIGKVAMVGDTSTVILSQSLAAEYLEAQAILTPLSSAAQQARGSAKNHLEYREKARAQVERVSVEIAKFLESAAADGGVLNALQRSQARFQAEVQDHWAKEIEELKLAAKEINQFMSTALEVMAPIAESSAKLLIAVRRELGQTTDEAQLLNSIKAQRNAAFQRLHELIAKLESQRKEEERAQQGIA